MSWKQIRWAALGAMLGLPCLVTAEDVIWRPVSPTAPLPRVVVATSQTRSSAPPPRPPAAAAATAASLGKPVPIASSLAQAREAAPPTQPGTVTSVLTPEAPTPAPVRPVNYLAGAGQSAAPVSAFGAPATGSPASGVMAAGTRTPAAGSPAWVPVQRGQVVRGKSSDVSGAPDPLTGGSPPLPPAGPVPPASTLPPLPPFPGVDNVSASAVGAGSPGSGSPGLANQDLAQNMPEMPVLTPGAVEPPESSSPPAGALASAPLSRADDQTKPVSHTAAQGTTHVASGPPDVPPPPPGGAPVPPPGGAFPGGEYNPSVVLDRPLGTSMWDRCRNWFDFREHGSGCPRSPFQSDPAFPSLISPVTMPFYFEDPRSLTEVRPIFIYQSAPKDNPLMGGGHSEFFGTQARLALTERLSLVVSEFGLVSLNPDNPRPGFDSGTGFAEVKLGPKFTFLRNPESKSVAAIGLNFEIPVGSEKVYQNTGTLGFNPYVTYATSFGPLPSGFGSFNFISAAGYAFSTDDQRSQYLHSHLHMDYNVANANKFFPLVEVNYFYYTKNGTATDFGSEGADLVNFGSRTTRGRNYLSVASGARYKFSEHFVIGAAAEWPITDEKGLSDFRLTFDVIFRY